MPGALTPLPKPKGFFEQLDAITPEQPKSFFEQLAAIPQQGAVEDAAKRTGRSLVDQPGALTQGLGTVLDIALRGLSARAQAEAVAFVPGTDPASVREAMNTETAPGRIVKDTGKQMRQDAGELYTGAMAPDAARNDTLLAKVADNVGPLAASIATPGGIAAKTLSGMVLNSQSAADDAERIMLKRGEPEQKARDEAARQFVLNLPAGALESVAWGRLFGRYGKSLADAVDQKWGKTALQRIVKTTLEQGGIEGGEEWLQQLSQNAAAKGTFAKDRDLTEGAGEAALLGAIMGGGLAGGVQTGAELATKIDDTGKNKPERTQDLQAQQKQLIAGDRAAQMYPLGTRELPLPKGMARVETPRGVFHFDPRRMTADEILTASEKGRENDVLGLGPYSKDEVADRAKKGEPVAVLTERGAQGEELRGALVTPSTLPETKAELEANKSEGSTVQLERPAETLAQRDLAAEVESSLPDTESKDYVRSRTEQDLEAQAKAKPDLNALWKETIDAALTAGAGPKELTALDRNLEFLLTEKKRRKLTQERVENMLENTVLDSALRGPAFSRLARTLATGKAHIEALRAELQGTLETARNESQPAVAPETGVLSNLQAEPSLPAGKPLHPQAGVLPKQGDQIDRLVARQKLREQIAAETAAEAKKAEEIQRKKAIAEQALKEAAEKRKAESERLAAIDRTGRDPATGKIADLRKVPSAELENFDWEKDRYMEGGQEVKMEDIEAILLKRAQEEERAAATGNAAGYSLLDLLKGKREALKAAGLSSPLRLLTPKEAKAQGKMGGEHERLRERTGGFAFFTKNGLAEDDLRERLHELGFPVGDVNDAYALVERALNGEDVRPERGMEAQFARREAGPDRNQSDLFAGGETGGDTLFNLQGEEAKDYTGTVDQQTASREAKQQAERDQGTLFRRRGQAGQNRKDLAAIEEKLTRGAVDREQAARAVNAYIDASEGKPKWSTRNQQTVTITEEDARRLNTAVKQYDAGEAFEWPDESLRNRIKSSFSRRPEIPIEALTVQWERNLKKIAPGLAKEAELRFGSSEALVEEGIARRDELTGEEEAARVRDKQAKKEIFYLFEHALRRNTPELTRLNLQHEMAHAFWDTLDRTTQRKAQKLFNQEIKTKTGPLYDDEGNLRENVALGATEDVQEWFAERMGHANDSWAKRRIQTGAHADTFIARMAAAFRSLLLQMRELMEKHLVLNGYNDTLLRDFRAFLDQGAKWQQNVEQSVIQLKDGAKLSRDPSMVTVRGRESKFAIRVHHGTPHKIDRFTTSKIGTGEGHQVYGWGLYFAENPLVAEQYRKNISSGRVQKEVLEEYFKPGDSVPSYAGTDKVLDFQWNDGNWFVKVQGEDGRTRTHSTYPDQRAFEQKKIRLGNTYTADLLPSAEEFLDWDSRLSEQSEKVLGVAKKLFPELFSEKWVDGPLPIGESVQTLADADPVRAKENGMWRAIPAEIMMGSDLYRYASEKGRGDRPDKRAASLNLLNAGISGVRYLDEGSRKNYRILSPQESVRGKWVVGESPNGPNEFFDNETEARARFAALQASRTRNYVLFDDRQVKIIAENGQARFARRAKTDAEFDAALKTFDQLDRQLEEYNQKGTRPPRELLTALSDAREVLEESWPGWRQTLNERKAEAEANGLQSPEPEPGVSAADDAREIAPEATAWKRSRLEAASFRPPGSMGQWLAGLGKLLGNFRSAIPELPGGAKGREFTRFRQGWRMLKASTEAVRREAEEQVGDVLEPITQLGRQAIHPDTYRRLVNVAAAIKSFNDKSQPAPARLHRELAELENKLETLPYHLFRKTVLYRDLWFRSKIQNAQGNPITLPMNLTREEVESTLAELHSKIAESPDRAAIEESLKRHYALVKATREDLLARGYIIPEELRNPLYFPHLVLEKFSGRLQNVKLDTAEDFRGYLQQLVGSAKDIETDYLTAMYYHVGQVKAHNARMDIVADYWQPYDIKADLEQEAKELNAQRAEQGLGALHWRQLVPKDHVIYTVDDRIPLRPEYVINRQVLADKLGVALGEGDLQAQLRDLGLSVTLTAEDFQAAMAAGEKQQWVLPREVAAALDGIMDRETKSRDLVGRVIGAPQSAWKRWTLYAPHNTIRYNYGNLVSDIEKLFSVDPAVFRLLPEALREVRAFAAGAEGSTDLREAFKRGVFQAVTAAEVPEVTQNLDRFEAYTTNRDKLLRWLKLWDDSPLTNWGKNFAEHREAAFRYAKYKADLARMRRGEKPIYAGAYSKDVEAIEDSKPGANDAIYAKAAEVARKTFVDYGDMSVSGDGLRRYLVPFYSWMEGNFKYHANLFRNMVDLSAGAGMSQLARGGLVAASKVVLPRTVTGTLLRLALPYAAVMLWNNSGDREELEKTLSAEDRRRFHIVVGKDDRGQTIVIYAPTALSDVAEWFGGNEFARLAGEYWSGRITLPQLAHEWVHNVPKATLNKAVQGITPHLKTVFEVLAKKQFFPDVMDARSIADHDLSWHILGNMTDQATADWIRRALDEDNYSPRTFKDWAQQAILQARRRDPETWGYYATLDHVDEWQQAHGGVVDFGVNNRADALLLRSFRRAIRAADVPAAIQFYHKLLDAGYTAERFAASVRAADPLQTLKREYRKEFFDQLSPAQQEDVRNGYRYAQRMEAFKHKERKLFPSERASQAYKARFAANPRDDIFGGIILDANNRSDQDEELKAEKLLESALRK